MGTRTVICSSLKMAKSKQLTRLEPWHHDLIDWWIANSRASGRAAAAHFDVSPLWISIVKHSPIFQEESRRRRERLSRAVEDQLRERATALAEESLDVMQERLERDRETVPLRQVAQVTKTAAQLLGLVGRGAVLQPQGQVVQLSVDPVVLTEARERASEAGD